MEPAAKPLIEGHGALDEIITIDRNWLKSPRAIWRMRRSLRERRFDIAIDPQGLTKSSIIGWLSGAERRIGFMPEDGRELSPLLNNRLVQRRSDNVVDRYLELLGALNCDSPQPDYRLPVDQTAESTIEQFVLNENLCKRYAVINPGAGWASRRWSNERFAKVAVHLSEKHSLPSVIAWADDAEHEMAQQIVSNAGGAAIIAPPTTLQELASLMRGARMYLGTDTGPLHIAVAVGTQCISLHGTTPAEKSGPWGEGHATVQRRYDAGSSRKRRNTTNDAMLAITVEDVCLVCDELLEAPASRRAA